MSNLRARPCRNFSFDDVHAKGAELIASVAAQNGVERFVHVSHLNAAHDSPSAFYRSKAAGEELVKEAFPAATIVRPAIMFGYEDKLLNNMASECSPSSAAFRQDPHDRALLVWPIWWKLNNMETKVRPAHVSPNLRRRPCSPADHDPTIIRPRAAPHRSWTSRRRSPTPFR